jgi:hypothetical protein
MLQKSSKKEQVESIYQAILARSENRVRRSNFVFCCPRSYSQVAYKNTMDVFVDVLSYSLKKDLIASQVVELLTHLKDLPATTHTKKANASPIVRLYLQIWEGLKHVRDEPAQLTPTLRHGMTHYFHCSY